MYNSSSAPWFTKDLKHLIRCKNRLFKRALASGIPDHWKIYCLARNMMRRSGQSVTASDFGSNGPRFESGRGRCVESLDKALHSHCPKEKPSH